MHPMTKWHSNQSMDNKCNRKGDYIEECINGRNGTAIKSCTRKIIELEITLKNASKDEMAQQSRHGLQR